MKQFEEYLIRIGKSENTALTYCRNIRMYFSWCRDSFGSEPKELYRSNVLEYISYMRNIRGYSPKSVNNHLSALRCLNKYLVQSGRQSDMAVMDSDFMKVQIQYASPCSVDKKEVEAFRQRMLESGSKRDFAIVTLLVYAGLRRSECVNLKLDQVDLIAKEIRVIGKGDKQRLVYAHALCRNDGKVFYKNNLPNEIPELAVGLLLDESGSMCSCDRCTYARAAAIILYDFCESLEIPVMVYGHSTDCYDGKNSVELYSYAEFNGFDNDDKYRLMDISARGSNRDGAALRYVAEALSKRSEAVKLLILVSDGQPADTGYYGTAAEEDLRGIKQEYQRKGILFVAAAIGNDKQNIERIYGDSFLDITDLNQLPTKLTGVVKRHIRV